MPTYFRSRTPRGARDTGELSARDRTLLVAALRALLHERLRAVEIVRGISNERVRGALDQDNFGIADILQLARTLGKRADV